MPSTMLSAISRLSRLIFTKIHDVGATGDRSRGEWAMPDSPQSQGQRGLDTSSWAPKSPLLTTVYNSKELFTKQNLDRIPSSMPKGAFWDLCQMWHSPISHHITFVSFFSLLPLLLLFLSHTSSLPIYTINFPKISSSIFGYHLASIVKLNQLSLSTNQKLHTGSLDSHLATVFLKTWISHQHLNVRTNLY